MTIQVTLNANEFKKSGVIKGLTFNNGKYDSLKIVRFGNGRVYFMALSEEIGGKVGTFAKQMQLVDGQVIISFGKNDKMIIGTYADIEAANEPSEQIEETQTEELVSEPVKVNNKKSNNTLKVNKEVEIIPVRGYMSKVEEVEGKRIEHSEFDLYLVKLSKHWAVYEKNTGKRVTDLKSTKKEAMDKLKEFLNNYNDTFKELIGKSLEEDGYITEYKIGSWIKSA